MADTGNQGLLLWGMKQARVPPSSEYPLGHGRAIYFWSFIVALMLFSMGGLFSIYEGIHKLAGHEGLRSPWVAVAILLFAFAAEAVSLRVALGEVNKTRGAKPLVRWFRDTRRSELIIVMGEDSAALVGLSLALVAVLASIVSGDPLYDAIGSIAVGCLLVVLAVGLGQQIKGLLIGQSAAPQMRNAMRELLATRTEIMGVLELITLQQGEDVVAAVRAQMKAGTGDREMIDDIRRCKSALKAAFPQARWVLFEPGVAE